MKNKILIAISLLGLAFGSCNDWLDITPETEIPVGKMFEKQDGFQNALTGAYIDMKSNSAYGENLTFGVIEHLAQHWEPISSVSKLESELLRYNYQSELVQNYMGTIYAKLYTAIADANEILANIDGKKNIFEQKMYGMIKGEALAIRAYCHFDILRMFGPMPGKVGEGRILPYVKTVSLQYHDQHTYNQYIAFLGQDLLMADSLLKENDPMFIPKNSGFSVSSSASEFMAARQTRLNYNAVKALQARFYLWLGGNDNKTKAYACAKEVIESEYDGKKRYALGNSKSISDEDYSFSSEHIMAIYDHKLFEKANSKFKETGQYSKPKNQVVPGLYKAGTTDIRYTGLWTEITAANGSKFHIIKKYWQKKDEEDNENVVSASSAINQIPLLKLAEMYLIAMECTSLNDATALYDQFCIARDIPSVDIRTEEQLRNILIDEYNKEFYAEGQTFYAYKRLAVTDILWAVDPGNEAAYVVPLPLSEVSYGK